ncbi:hypothetical protein K491DRAFT_722031 [Lophiostoma macrostomum CBS 122681]|uniref:Uncharacterized protein n=1 Tax=Lophiostoma macrostomum CBS 122681 TaxID=1314788 RepID=A0A6A6SRM5_9PLEO|nr:hypothetical protein K491DRAFT_722031 [Lophiostoma macrostomum CBS 122681]
MASISLRPFQSTGRSVLIPASSVQTYEELRIVAYAVFSQDAHIVDVHFHFDSAVCEDEAVDFLWDLGSYFGPESLNDGKLLVFAHFVNKTNDDQICLAGPSNMVGSVHAEQSDNHHLNYDQQSSAGVNREFYELASDDEDTSEDGSLFRTFSRASSDDEMDDGQSISSNDADDNGDEFESLAMETTPDPAMVPYPPLPEGVTARGWKRDFQNARKVNASEDDPMHLPNWNNATKGRKGTFAHCRLMQSIYGIDNPDPCSCYLPAAKPLTTWLQDSFACRIIMRSMSTSWQAV